jgi:hypothetical protein
MPIPRTVAVVLRLLVDGTLTVHDFFRYVVYEDD